MVAKWKATALSIKLPDIDLRELYEEEKKKERLMKEALETKSDAGGEFIDTKLLYVAKVDCLLPCFKGAI